MQLWAKEFEYHHPNWYLDLNIHLLNLISVYIASPYFKKEQVIVLSWSIQSNHCSV